MKFDVNKSNMVKCIAIILMLIHHLFYCAPQLCGEVIWTPFEMNQIMEFSNACKICVGIFVFLTAYGIAKTYQYKFGDNDAPGREVAKVSIRRYAKLELNFLFVYILVLVTYFFRAGGVQSVYASAGWKKGIIYMIIDMLGLAYRFSTPTLNPTWWYMSTAIVLCFLIPVLVKLYNYLGGGIIVLGALLFFGTAYDGLSEYVACILIGLFCAKNNVLEWLYSKHVCSLKGLNNVIKIIAYMCIFSLLVCLRIKMDYHWWIDAIVPVICCGFCMELSVLCPVCEKVMSFVGKHSMNMFLVHTMIFMYYFSGFIYGFKHWLLVLLALMITSLLSSVVIEGVKRLIGYQKFIDKILRSIP